MSGRGNAECARGQRVAKLVQQHASEQCENEQHARNGSGRTANLVVRKSDPCQEEQECDVNANFRSGDSRDFN